jgi:UDP:flavonoid glycosyltransferase YjiC (YdhE family)
VPMLCIPLGRDQPLNAASVRALGAGRALLAQEGVGELRNALRELLADERPRAALRDLAVDGSGTQAADELERLAGAHLSRSAQLSG